MLFCSFHAEAVLRRRCWLWNRKNLRGSMRFACTGLGGPLEGLVHLHPLACAQESGVITTQPGWVGTGKKRWLEARSRCHRFVWKKRPNAREGFHQLSLSTSSSFSPVSPGSLNGMIPLKPSGHKPSWTSVPPSTHPPLWSRHIRNLICWQSRPRFSFSPRVLCCRGGVVTRPRVLLPRRAPLASLEHQPRLHTSAAYSGSRLMFTLWASTAVK